ncbi:MAG: TRAP transporter substrate-binding protein [Burkholderiaceae bacterium]|nr:TRAP transporter substrate-binding protein [Burkholderiaceae bacterium]
MGVANWRTVTGAIAFFMAAGPAAAQQVTLNVSSWAPAGHVLSQTVGKWCDEVAEATAKRVVCKLLPKPVAPPPGTFDAVREGLADVSYSVHAYTPDRYTLSQLAELPFSGDTAEANSIAYQRIFDRYLARQNEHRGLKVIAVFTHGPGQLYTTKKPVESLADLQGLKLRGDGGMVANVGKAIGVSIVLKPSVEAQELLSSGAIDGLFGPAETIDSMRLEKLIRYRIVFPGGLYNTSFAFVMNQATWDRIGTADQAAIARLSGEHAARMFGRAWDDVDGRALAAMQANDVRANFADRAFVEAVRARTSPIELKWITEARAKGLERPEQVLREFRAELTKLQ